MFHIELPSYFSFCSLSLSLFFSSFFLEGGGGGGVCLYLKELLVYNMISSNHFRNYLITYVIFNKNRSEFINMKENISETQLKSKVKETTLLLLFFGINHIYIYY